MRGLLPLIVLFLIIILGITLRYRLIIKKKNHAIIRHIKNQDRLEKTTEQLFRKYIILHEQLKIKSL